MAEIFANSAAREHGELEPVDFRLGEYYGIWSMTCTACDFNYTWTDEKPNTLFELGGIAMEHIQMEHDE